MMRMPQLIPMYHIIPTQACAIFNKSVAYDVKIAEGFMRLSPNSSSTHVQPASI
jgi:hypothetical protein